MPLAPTFLCEGGCGVKNEWVIDNGHTGWVGVIKMTAKSLLFKEYERVQGLAHHVTARGRLYDKNTRKWSIGLTKNFKILVEGPIGRAQVQNEDLIFTFIDDFGCTSAERSQFGVSEVAEKNRKLCMVPFTFEILKKTGASFVITDIIGY